MYPEMLENSDALGKVVWAQDSLSLPWIFIYLQYDCIIYKIPKVNMNRECGQHILICIIYYYVAFLLA